MRIADLIADYCREIETYLCRKNDGHLIRVVGPSFELVSSWAEQGVPLKVAFAGIDRCFERYYRKGPRRRPVKIDFCEADVLDVFDEWRRAVGFQPAGGGAEPTRSPSPSLVKHLERVVTRLTSARASGVLAAGADPMIDRVAEELERARAKAGGLRGAERSAVISRLAEIDAEMMRTARGGLDEKAQRDVEREADGDLAPFRATMAPDAFARARDAAVDRVVRLRLGLPTVTFSS